jgi:hypothetical protein
MCEPLPHKRWLRSVVRCIGTSPERGFLVGIAALPAQQELAGNSMKSKAKPLPYSFQNQNSQNCGPKKSSFKVPQSPPYGPWNLTVLLFI